MAWCGFPNVERQGGRHWPGTAELRASVACTADRDLTRLLGPLALPTFALALAMSVLTTYAPLLLGEATSSRARSGSLSAPRASSRSSSRCWSGRSPTARPPASARRLPYAVFAAPLLVLPLAILPFAHSYAQTVALVSLFFVGYFVYYPPYQALFAELVPASHQGRALGVQGMMRGLGLGAALVGGGLLPRVWTPLPVRARRRCPRPLHRRARARSARAAAPARRGGRAAPRPGRACSGSCASAARAARLRGRQRPLGAQLHGAEDLHRPLRRQGPRGVGRARPRPSSASSPAPTCSPPWSPAGWPTGSGCTVSCGARSGCTASGCSLAPRMTSLGPMLLALPFVAIAGAVVMTLPYGLLVSLTPAGAEGAASGLFGFSRALGAALGPDRGRRRHRRPRPAVRRHARLRRHVGGHRGADPALAAASRAARAGRSGARKPEPAPAAAVDDLALAA